MKKVLVLTSTFPRWHKDSTADFVEELSKRLSQKNRGIIVLAPHAYRALKKEERGNISIMRFQYFVPAKLQKVAYGAGIIPNVKSSILAKIQVPFFVISELIAARKIIKNEKPALLHAHWLIPHGLLCAIFKKIYGIPFIVTVHGSDLFALKSKLFIYFQKIVFSACDLCTVNTIATRDEAIRRFPQFKSKIKLIPMGVDTKLFSKRNVKPKFKKYKNHKIILFVGRLNKQKGIDYLIKAMPAIIQNIPNAKLLIIGEGSYKSELEKAANSLNMSANVEFLGPIYHNKLPDYYNLADVFVLPSITSDIGVEGQGLVLLEAMSCGTCVIGSNTGGIKFLIKDGENGLLVEEKDEQELARKITEVLGNKNLKSKLSKKGMQTARKNYSWEFVSKQFEDAYRSLI